MADEDVAQPDEDVAEPDEDVAEPDEDVAEPDEDVAEPDEDVAEPDVARARPRSRWWGLASAAAAAYVVAVAADAVVLAADGPTYLDLHRHLDGLGARAALSVVLVGVLAHLLDGVRRLLVAGGATSRLEDRLRLAVAFALPALGLPLVALVVGPALWGGAG